MLTAADKDVDVNRLCQKHLAIATRKILEKGYSRKHETWKPYLRNQYNLIPLIPEIANYPVRGLGAQPPASRRRPGSNRRQQGRTWGSGALAPAPLRPKNDATPVAPLFAAITIPIKRYHLPSDPKIALVRNWTTFSVSLDKYILAGVGWTMINCYFRPIDQNCATSGRNSAQARVRGLPTSDLHTTASAISTAALNNVGSGAF
ncbi:hypothetical protein J6590_074516 [Homalodisca vitripennis]|nr:hypothetical protein J6590_074516 [Homalodisca vitripennis]